MNNLNTQMVLWIYYFITEYIIYFDIDSMLFFSNSIFEMLYLRRALSWLQN